MSFENDNPYASPLTSDPPPEPPFVSRHDWRGHVVTVESKALASHLWMFTGYFVTIDGKTFFSSQFKLTEDFQWTFEHSGRMATGHFKAIGLNTGLVRKYSLTLDGEPLGTFRLRIIDGWKSYVAAVGICAIAIVILAWQKGGFRLPF